ncbi:hypothetical protein BDQ17DRAFT_1436997 [Cyathus striatus]|nr:hypothetical protein BDQ17DRAFT_1436997 [Cyathus striatus]
MSDGDKLEGEQQPHAGPSGTRSNFDEGPSITKIQSKSVSSGSQALQGAMAFTVGEDQGGALASAIPHHSPTAGSNVSESGGRVLSGTIPTATGTPFFGSSSAEAPIFGKDCANSSSLLTFTPVHGVSAFPPALAPSVTQAQPSRVSRHPLQSFHPPGSGYLFESDLSEKLDELVEWVHNGKLSKPYALAVLWKLLPDFEPGDDSPSSAADIRASFLTQSFGKPPPRPRPIFPPHSSQPAAYHVSEEDFPWFNESLEEASKLHPNVIETQRLLDKYAQDIIKVKHSVICMSNIPHFPECEWDNILRGKAINLGNISSGINATSATTSRTQCISELKSFFQEPLPPLKNSPIVVSGTLPGNSPLRQCSELSLIKDSNLHYIHDTSPDSFGQLPMTSSSSHSTNPLDSTSKQDGTFISVTSNISDSWNSPSSHLEGPIIISFSAKCTKRKLAQVERSQGRYVENTIHPLDVGIKGTNANINISVANVSNWGMLWQTASEDVFPFGLYPSYLYELHSFSPSSFSLTPVLSCTLYAPPLPHPLSEILNHPFICSLIRNNPDVFKIVTPLKVEQFEFYLASHPNKPLVDSFCLGLHVGFWPFAHHRDDFPLTHNESYNQPSQTPDEEAFLYSQRNQEVALGRFSKSPSIGIQAGHFLNAYSCCSKIRSR